MTNIIPETIADVVDISNWFERCNTDLKRRYLIKIIEDFNRATAQVTVNRGTFGTGYPFYVLNVDLTGELPVIQEQIRYNGKLLEEALTSRRTTWSCQRCLYTNYEEMPDLKQICKPCPNMDNELKPRKVINRLPDMDMWLVCADGKLGEAQVQLTEVLRKVGMNPSDVDPLQSIKDIKEITESLENGIMPQKFLPMDVHIIEYSKLKGLIEQVPEILKSATELGKVPYLPIHPKSYRKIWQYDDEAYNFIYDYLSAFTEFGFNEELNGVLTTTRSEVGKTYSKIELYEFLLKSATAPNARRLGEKALQEQFIKKMSEWRKIQKIGEQTVNIEINHQSGGNNQVNVIESYEPRVDD